MASAGSLIFGTVEDGGYNIASDSVLPPIRMIINPAGYVGIGTTSPSALLNLERSLSNENANFMLLVDNKGTTAGKGYGLGIYTDATDAGSYPFYVDIAGTPKAWINGVGTTYLAGNVGIGTTTPTHKLNVVGNSNLTGNLTIRSNLIVDGISSSSVGGSAPFIQLSSVSDLNYSVIQQGTGGLDFWAYTDNWYNRMRITNGGNVGIGTTAPSAMLSLGSAIPSMPKLLMYDAGNDWNNGFGINIGGGNSIALVLSRGVGNQGGDSQFNIVAPISAWPYTSYATLMTVINNGNVGIGTTSPSQKLSVVGSINQTGALSCALSTDASGTIICTSDERSKNVLGNSTYGLNQIMNITPIKFNFKNEIYTHVGFSAQNVQKVIPEATPLQNDGYLGLDTNAIIATMVNAIKEQQQIIISQNDTINYLKDENNLIKSELCKKDNTYRWC